MLTAISFLSFRQIVRHSSKITVRENLPSKFSVVNGKFVRVPEKDGKIVSEEITHTGMVSF